MDPYAPLQVMNMHKYVNNFMMLIILKIDIRISIFSEPELPKEGIIYILSVNASPETDLLNLFLTGTPA